MHIAPYDNKNIPIVDVNHDLVPLNYFNIIKLSKGKNFSYRLNQYETCIVPATGTIDIDVDGQHFNSVGNRSIDVWGGEPEGVYVPTDIAIASTFVSFANIFASTGFVPFDCSPSE